MLPLFVCDAFLLLQLYVQLLDRQVVPILTDAILILPLIFYFLSHLGPCDVFVCFLNFLVDSQTFVTVTETHNTFWPFCG